MPPLTLPSLLFSEILAVPNVIEIEGTTNSAYLDLLRLFAHGAWSDYKKNSSHLPQLVSDQILKFKQFTVLTMAERNKILTYDELMRQLAVTKVRELEDFLINECMYVGIVRGKLDQLRRCFEGEICDLNYLGIGYKQYQNGAHEFFEQCKQGDVDVRGNGEINSEVGGVLDYKEDRS